MNAALQNLQQRISHTFRQPDLLKLAVTHSSLVNENPDISESNQRLEFLGDAVLQLVLTSELYQLYPEEREGALSQHRATLSKGSFLSQLAREIQLHQCLLLSKSEEDSGGRERASALEDAFEALVAALYLDAGLETTTKVLLNIYGPLNNRLTNLDQIQNPKGRLQELVQPLHGNNALRYEVTATTGEDHEREYEVTVYFKDQSLATGKGTSKKLAEEAAARGALKSWTVPPAE